MPIIQKHSRPTAPVETTASPSPTIPSRLETRAVNESKRHSRLASVVIAVTFQRLTEDASREWTLEEGLVLQALRRSTASLRTANAQELSDYLGPLSQDQLRGVASNVKGIYHELLFVQAENGDWDSVAAKVKEFTNHPGGDVEFIGVGASLEQFEIFPTR